jgi:NAD-dependent SIR2 family protein deacetylase
MTEKSSKFFKSTTLPNDLYDFLEKYKENKRLRSIAQAIDFIATEAGYDVTNYPCKIKIEPTAKVG